jgi:hypothetical protein
VSARATSASSTSSASFVASSVTWLSSESSGVHDPAARERPIRIGLDLEEAKVDPFQMVRVPGPMTRRRPTGAPTSIA